MSDTLYFVQPVDGGLVKIGYTSGPVSGRLQSLQGHCPLPLRVLATRPGTRIDESKLHRQLKASQQHGEWFEPSTEVMAEVAASTPYAGEVAYVGPRRWGGRRKSAT